MEPSVFSPASVHESSTRFSWVKVTGIVVVIITLVAGGYFLYRHFFGQGELVVTTETSEPYSYGEANGIGSATGTPYGVLYYSSPSALYPQNAIQSFARQYDFVSAQSTSVDYRSARDFNAIGNTESVLLMAEDDIYDSQTWKPYYLNRETEAVLALPRVDGHWINDLALAPDREHYVYAYTSERDPSPNLRTIADWHLAIHEMSTGESTIIDAAAEPAWVNEGADLLYLGQAGIMLYNVATGETRTLFADYTPFDYFDDVVVSPDSHNVILTVPFLQGKTFVSVLEFANDELVEVSRIVSDDTKRRSPVFSPDGRYYAVVAAKEKRADGSDNVPETEQVVEIRSLDGVDPVQTITLNEEAKPVELEAWSAQ